MPGRYVLTTPVRDEIDHLPDLLATIEAQELRPTRWLVVDDGSTDGSLEWLRGRAAERDWMEVVRAPEPADEYLGAHVARVKRFGLERALEGIDAGFAGVLDADILLPPEHYRVLLEAFEADPELGITSSVIRSPGAPREAFQREDLPRGGTHVFRVDCLRDIGGLPPWPGFDGAANVLARLRGWSCRLLPELVADQARETATRFGAGRGYARKGRYAWFLGLNPGLVAIRAAAYSVRAPRTAGLHFAAGWLGQALRRAPRCPDPEVRAYYRWQRPKEYLGRLVGRRGPGFVSRGRSGPG